MDDITVLALAAASFVGSHYLLSHPFRAALVGMIGERLFLLLYSLVSFATLFWAIHAFMKAPGGPLLWHGWAVLPWLVASVLTIPALALLLGSFARNPAMPQAPVAGLAGRNPQGAFAVTRHPMMMGIALWALAHVIVAPSARVIVLMAAMIGLALGGAHLQDRKKIALLGGGWQAWIRRTSFWPRLSRLGRLGWYWVLALALWFGATWLHVYVAGIPAGLWRWL